MYIYGVATEQDNFLTLFQTFILYKGQLMDIIYRAQCLGYIHYTQEREEKREREREITTGSLDHNCPKVDVYKRQNLTINESEFKFNIFIQPIIGVNKIEKII